MSSTPDRPTGADGYSPEERLDILETEGVVTVDTDETVYLTADFESTHGIYHDSYIDVDEAEYLQAVADVFGIDPEDAAERVEELGVTREQFIALLALNSYIDGEYPLNERAHMAMMVSDLAPESPVPDVVIELDDDSYEGFLSEHDRAAITVWKLFCEPCDRMKAELDETLAGLPDDVAVAGIDGENAPSFRRDFEVEAAPSVLFFEDGECVELLRGYQSPVSIEAACSDAYGDDA